MRILVTGEITPATAARFVAKVEGCQDMEIEVLIDCPGGDLDAAFVMANALHAAEARTTAALLKADSAALYVALGAARRIAARDGSALLHNVMIEMPRATSLTASELRVAAEDTERKQRAISWILERKTGAPDSWWRTLMARNTRLTAEAMLKHRLISAISPWPSKHLRAGAALGQ